VDSINKKRSEEKSIISDDWKNKKNKLTQNSLTPYFPTKN